MVNPIIAHLESRDYPEIAELSPLNGTPTLPESHRRHRQDFKAFVEQETKAWQHSADATRLYALFDEWNAAYYDSVLTVPYLCLLEPGSPRTYGDTSRMSGWGGKLQIRLRPSLLIGTHPHMRPGPEYAEGRFLFIADVLLHEIVHQYHEEITGETENSFHGHGPQFRDVCNRIGSTLGLPPVRSSKKKGPDRDLPSCAQWPHNVRPADYYQGAYVLPVPETPVPKPIAVCDTCLTSADLASEALEILERGRVLTVPEWHMVKDCLQAILEAVPSIGDDEGEEVPDA